jgi:rod shape-determining protein MreC
VRKKSKKTNKGRSSGLNGIILIGLLLTMVLIFLVYVLGNQRFGSLHELIFEVAGPVQKVFSSGTDSLNSLKRNYWDLLSVREDNERLRAELQKCRLQCYKNREALATNIKLRRLLDFRESSGLPMISARIIGKDPSVWFRSVVVDRGSGDGIDKGMAVVNGDGVVGQVFSVSPNYAKVLLAIAPSSAIDVLLQKSRVRGILRGNGTSIYRLDYVLKTALVTEGDFVVTAGYGGVFPAGMPVGVVSKVIKNRRGMFLEIEVTPVVDYLTIEDLLIIERKVGDR